MTLKRRPCQPPGACRSRVLRLNAPISHRIHPKRCRKSLLRCNSLPKQTEQLARKGGEKIEICKSDHDFGPFGRCFELGSLCSQAGNYYHKRGHHDRLFQVIERVGSVFPTDGPLTKGPGRFFRPGLFPCLKANAERQCQCPKAVFFEDLALSIDLCS